VLIKDVKNFPKDAPTELLFEKNKDFIAKYGKSDDTHYEFVMAEFLRINGVYWSNTALYLMGGSNELDTNEIMEFVESCKSDINNGYGPTIKHDPHLLYTLSAIQIAAERNTLDKLDKEKLVNYIKSLQQEDGSFVGDKWGEVDTRFSFCAVAALALLGELNAIDIDAAVEFVKSCMNFDGGFGTRPGSESHAGQIYCCVGFLSIVGRLDVIDADLLGWWLAERQLNSGGLNGRPEKLPDVCYSWWVLSCLAILGRLHWIDRKKLTEFILASQDHETGGISDRPGDLPDPFHTLFGIAGLSLLGHDERLFKVNPVFCMPEAVIERLGIKIQQLKI